MVTEVELTGVASTSRGGPVGAEEGNREHQAACFNVKIYLILYDKFTLYHPVMF